MQPHEAIFHAAIGDASKSLRAAGTKLKRFAEPEIEQHGRTFALKRASLSQLKQWPSAFDDDTVNEVRICVRAGFEILPSIAAGSREQRAVTTYVRSLDRAAEVYQAAHKAYWEQLPSRPLHEIADAFFAAAGKIKFAVHTPISRGSDARTKAVENFETSRVLFRQALWGRKITGHHAARALLTSMKNCVRNAKIVLALSQDESYRNSLDKYINKHNRVIAAFGPIIGSAIESAPLAPVAGRSRLNRSPSTADTDSPAHPGPHSSTNPSSPASAAPPWGSAPVRYETSYLPQSPAHTAQPISPNPNQYPQHFTTPPVLAAPAPQYPHASVPQPPYRPPSPPPLSPVSMVMAASGFQTLNPPPYPSLPYPGQAAFAPLLPYSPGPASPPSSPMHFGGAHPFPSPNSPPGMAPPSNSPPQTPGGPPLRPPQRPLHSQHPYDNGSPGPSRARNPLRRGGR